MTVQPEDVYELLRKIRYDATAIQAKVTDALSALTELKIPDQPAIACKCGLEFRGQHSLDEHVYTSHNGPEPPHWLDIEARSVDPDELVRARATPTPEEGSA